MDGVPIGRKVDLKSFTDYDNLSSAVDELFRGLLAGTFSILAQFSKILQFLTVKFSYNTVYMFIVGATYDSGDSCQTGLECLIFHIRYILYFYAYANLKILQFFTVKFSFNTVYSRGLCDLGDPC